MPAINAQTTVGQLVVENPGRALVLERLGLDYCCGGGRSLAEACAERGLEPETVVSALAERDAASPASEHRDWSSAPLGELADHIVATHHAYLNEALPRLSYLTERVLNAHGDRHPQVAEVKRVFESLRAELESHATKEEMVLFPICHQLDKASTLPQFHCGSVANPIRVMEMEHDRAGDALAQLRKLTDDFTAPADVCNTYRAMLHALAELEADLHTHIHKENNILFPRAVRVEDALAAA